MIELLVVIVVLCILASIAVISLASTRKYAPDDQARLLTDAFDEARQKALNQRQTFRVEINKTRNRINVIDENKPEDVTDDVIVKSQAISSQVLVGVTPSNVTSGPTTTSPIPVRPYVSSNYPLSNGDTKITLRFKKNGQVTDTGNDNIGTGSLTTGATIYVHSITPSVNNPDIIRAVALLGTSGDNSVYKCTITAGVCGNWVR